MSEVSTKLPEVIFLCWEEVPDRWYVRGHVEDDLAVAAVREHLQVEFEDDFPEGVPELAVDYRTRARWRWPNDIECGPAGDQGVRLLAESRPGRGAFPVTVVRFKAHIDADRAEREYRRQTPQRSLALFLTTLPELTDPRWVPTGDGTIPEWGHVEAQVPGCQHPIIWTEKDPTRVRSHPDDVEAVKAWAAARRARRLAADHRQGAAPAVRDGRPELEDPEGRL